MKRTSCQQSTWGHFVIETILGTKHFGVEVCCSGKIPRSEEIADIDLKLLLSFLNWTLNHNEVAWLVWVGFRVLVKFLASRWQEAHLCSAKHHSIGNLPTKYVIKIKHKNKNLRDYNFLQCLSVICLPVTWGLQWQRPVSWLQPGTPPVGLLMMPMSLQLQRMQPSGFEAFRPYQPGKQSAHRRPVTAALHWHWPPTWRCETQRKRRKQVFNWLKNI